MNVQFNNTFFLTEDKKKHLKKVFKRNRMNVFFAENRSNVCQMILDSISPQDVIGFGYSVTLLQLGVVDLLKKKGYKLLNRFNKNLSKIELIDILNKTLSADVFITGSNAITFDGKIVNKDGMGTRTAPMIYGPEKVIVVIGRNKIVRNVEEALYRIETISAPLNCRRKKLKTSCVKTGVCRDCHTPDRICCATVIIEYQRRKDRISLIILNEDIGY